MKLGTKVVRYCVIALMISSCKPGGNQPVVPTDSSSSVTSEQLKPDAAEEMAKRKRNRELDIEDNIKHLNDVLPDSARIDHFAMYQFLADTIPRDIFKLKHLRRLSVMLTYLEEIPEDICDLRELEDVEFDRNKLKSIKNIACLTNLSRLSLIGNKLTTIEGLSNLKRLQYLNISNNNFSGGIDAELPENLEELMLGNSKLKSFPLSILNLNELITLHLANNKELTHIPVGISKMKKLKEIILDGTSVPRDEVLKLAKLMPWCEIYKDESRQEKAI
ncbi:MAG TPA: leucine-rich repeat domain-containing protein [Chryseolinea sp.]